MQDQELKECIARIEQCADDAKAAAQAGTVPDVLRQAVDDLHQQARQAKQAANRQQPDAQAMRQSVMQLEQTGDKAMQACRQAGNAADAKTQQAVQRAHDEISGLKKRLLQEA